MTTSEPAPRVLPLPADAWGDAEYGAFGRLLVGTYAMLAMVFATWGLPTEPGFAALPEPTRRE